jgi:hypothetical protein
MNDRVEIAFDCLPLRSVTRWDIPLDASEGFHAFCQRIKRAASKHGLYNSYYLYNAKCTFALANDPAVGAITFSFEGTVLTDSEDRKTVHADLEIKLQTDTSDWLTGSAVAWFRETVARAVMIEFDRYIRASDLSKTAQRLHYLEWESNAVGAYVGVGI